MVNINLENKIEEMEKLYWEEGYTRKGLAINYDCKQNQIQRLFIKYNIPTFRLLIRNFTKYKRNPKVDYYLKYYMQNFNRFIYNEDSNKIRWRVKNIEEKPILGLGKYLEKKTGITYSVNRVIEGKSTPTLLDVFGLKNCILLTNYFDLDWRSEIEDIIEDSAQPMTLRLGEAAYLVLSFVGKEWRVRSEITKDSGIDNSYAHKILEKAVENRIIEKRKVASGEKYKRHGLYEYRLLIDPNDLITTKAFSTEDGVSLDPFSAFS